MYACTHNSPPVACHVGSVPGGNSFLHFPKGDAKGNVGGGEASGILAQWEASRASDGHFVIYAIPEAMEQAAEGDQS